ncbi:LysM peptidoglycan-binding domain-containing protein [Pseudomonadota bacterium]
MGIFETIKNAFGNKADTEPAVVVGPTQMLRDAGLDPGKLKFGFSPGSISVSGEIAVEADRQKILDVLAGTPGISNVYDHMTVAVPQAPVSTPAETGDGPRSYTVQSGDTLWKIAQEMYGKGSEYMKIYEANTDLLKNPDNILPGQKLVIPE